MAGATRSLTDLMTNAPYAGQARRQDPFLTTRSGLLVRSYIPIPDVINVTVARDIANTDDNCLLLVAGGLTVGLPTGLTLYHGVRVALSSGTTPFTVQAPAGVSVDGVDAAAVEIGNGVIVNFVAISSTEYVTTRQVLGDNVSSITVDEFYSPTYDATANLNTYLDTKRGRLAEDFAGDKNNIAILVINFKGRNYKTTSPITLNGDLSGIVLANGSLSADAGSLSWGPVDAVDPTSMLQFHGTSPSRVIRSGISNFTLNTNRVTNGVSIKYSVSFVCDNVDVFNFTRWGIKASVNNRRLSINGGTLQEFGNNDPLGKVMANRTGYGLWIEKSDGHISDTVMPICKRGIFVTNIRNLKFSGVHPWMGDLNDENERFTAYTVEIGNIDVDPDEDEDKSEPSGLWWDSCYFDHGGVVMSSYGHQFDNCNFTGGELGIPAFILVATEPNRDAAGLKIANIRVSRQHGAFIQLLTQGTGTWKERKLWQISQVSYGSDKIAPSKFLSSIHMYETGENARTWGNDRVWDDLSHVQIAEGGSSIDIPIGGLRQNFEVHSKLGAPGYMATGWNGKIPGVSLARSKSTNVGTFGGQLLLGDVAGFFTASADSSTSFAGLLNGIPGAGLRAFATANHAANSTPLGIQLTVVPPNTTVPVVAWSTDIDGNLVSSFASIGSEDAPTSLVVANRMALVEQAEDLVPSPVTGAATLEISSTGVLYAIMSDGSRRDLVPRSKVVNPRHWPYNAQPSSLNSTTQIQAAIDALFDGGSGWGVIEVDDLFNVSSLVVPGPISVRGIHGTRSGFSQIDGAVGPVLESRPFQGRTNVAERQYFRSLRIMGNSVGALVGSGSVVKNSPIIGSAVVPVGVAVGHLISGVGIPQWATVTSLSPLTMSVNATATNGLRSQLIFHRAVQKTCTGVIDEYVLACSDVTGIQVGMRVRGDNLDEDTGDLNVWNRVMAINGLNVTLDRKIKTSGTFDCTFFVANEGILAVEADQAPGFDDAKKYEPLVIEDCWIDRTSGWGIALRPKRHATNIRFSKVEFSRWGGISNSACNDSYLVRVSSGSNARQAVLWTAAATPRIGGEYYLTYQNDKYTEVRFVQCAEVKVNDCDMNGRLSIRGHKDGSGDYDRNPIIDLSQINWKYFNNNELPLDLETGDGYVQNAFVIAQNTVVKINGGGFQPDSTLERPDYIVYVQGDSHALIQGINMSVDPVNSWTPFNTAICNDMSRVRGSYYDTDTWEVEDIVGVPSVTVPTLDSLLPYNLSATQWRDIPYGTGVSWNEPTLGGTTVSQAFDIDLPSTPAPTGGYPVIVHYHPNGNSKSISNGGQVDTNLRQPALAAGFAFVSVEFRHPVTNESLGSPHTDVGLSLQGIRSLHDALNLNRGQVYAVGRSRGNLVIWQSLQADMQNPSATSYSGRQSSLVQGILSVNGQATYSTQRFCELYVQPADHAALLLANPDNPAWGSAIDDVPTAPQLPPIWMMHDAPWFNRLATLAEANANLLHFPEASRLMKEAYTLAGAQDRIVAVDDESDPDIQLQDAVNFFSALRESATAVEAAAIARSRRLDAGLYYFPDGWAGLYGTAAYTGDPSVGGAIGGVVDGQYGLANRLLAGSALGYPAGQTSAANKPVLADIGGGYFGVTFDSNDRLVVARSSDGTPSFYAWTTTAEIPTYANATTSNVFFGQPQMTGATMVLASVMGGTGVHAPNDLKILRQFAAVMTGVSY